MAKTQKQLLKDHHLFIRTPKDDESNSNGNLIAIHHYSTLYKEYCVCDLTYYKRGKVGLRWCTQADILALKGINICCEQHCNNNSTLFSYEVKFKYIEHSTNKTAMVKVNLCKDCAFKLTYKNENKDNIL